MIFVKSLYQQYTQRYGPPEVNDYGRAFWPQTKEQFVKDAKTGKIIVHTREVRYIGKSSEGYNLYLGPKSKLGEFDKAYPSFVRM